MSLVSLSSRALAENWVTVATQSNLGHVYKVDKDSIRRGSDGLIYFATHDELSDDHRATDCQLHIIFTLDEGYGGKPMELTEWRKDGEPVKPGSSEEAELQYVCANAP